VFYFSTYGFFVAFAPFGYSSSNSNLTRLVPLFVMYGWLIGKVMIYFAQLICSSLE